MLPVGDGSGSCDDTLSRLRHFQYTITLSTMTRAAEVDTATDTATVNELDDSVTMTGVADWTTTPAAMDAPTDGVGDDVSDRLRLTTVDGDGLEDRDDSSDGDADGN